jgi:hypothetical protein
MPLGDVQAKQIFNQGLYFWVADNKVNVLVITVFKRSWPQVTMKILLGGWGNVDQSGEQQLPFSLGMQQKSIERELICSIKQLIPPCLTEATWFPLLVSFSW